MTDSDIWRHSTYEEKTFLSRINMVLTRSLVSNPAVFKDFVTDPISFSSSHDLNRFVAKRRDSPEIIKRQFEVN